MRIEPADRRRLPDDAVIEYRLAGDGWAIRTLRLRPAEPARGALLFANGRADFIEKYLESLLHWRDEGWDVTAFDWRGQGGSGRLAPDPLLGHAEDFDVWLNDLATLERGWRADVAGPHFLIGHSMGGHLALRYVAERKPDLAGLVLSSPMIAFRTPLPEMLVRRVAAAYVARGRAAGFAFGQASRPRFADGFRQRNLTGDPGRYEDELWWLARKPELALGGVSWGWLDAAYRSIDRMNAPGYVEGVEAPVLLFGSAHDRVVVTARAVALAARLPDREVTLFPGAHELLRECDNIRLPVWRRISDFIDGRTAGATKIVAGAALQR